MHSANVGDELGFKNLQNKVEIFSNGDILDNTLEFGFCSCFATCYFEVADLIYFQESVFLLLTVRENVVITVWFYSRFNELTEFSLEYTYKLDSLFSIEFEKEAFVFFLDGG